MNQQWVDIYAIPVPSGWILPGWLLIMLAIAIIAAVSYAFWFYRPVQQAKRRIRSLVRKVGGDATDNRFVIQQLHKILCQHFAASQLSRVTGLGAGWTEFRGRLITACYQQEIPDFELTKQLCREAIHHLKSPGMTNGPR